MKSLLNGVHVRIRIPRKLAAIAAASTVALGLVAAAPTANATTNQPPKPPKTVHSVQSKPKVQAGKVNAKATESLGATKTVATKAGKPTATVKAAAVAGVYFTTPYNYCWENFVYTPVYNSTSATKYIEVQLYANGSWRQYYTSIAAGGTAYVPWYGVSGTYYAYLYVWDGSSYSYNQYETNANNCNVSVTFTDYSSAGYVLATVKNNGTAYASVNVAELAPYATYGTYTGSHWVYPTAGGGVAYQWLYVGYLPFGIFADVYGSGYGVWTHTGDF